MTTQTVNPNPHKHPRFTVDAATLNSALDWASKAVPTRPSVPVLGGVLVDASDAGVSVTCFDYEVTRVAALAGATCEQAGRVLVPARKLAEMISKLPKGAGQVTVDMVQVNGSGEFARFSCGKTVYRLPTMPTEDYPGMPASPPTVGTMDLIVLAGMVEPVAAHAGRDSTLPTMTGVRIEAGGGVIAMLATDRYRLAMREKPFDGKEFATLVPAKTLADTVKWLAKNAGGAQVTVGFERYGDGNELFELVCGPYRMATRTLDASSYPPVRSLLPAHFAAMAEVDTAEMLEAVGRVAVACEKATPVRLTFRDGQVVARAGGTDEAVAEETLDAVYTPTGEKERKAIAAAVTREAKAKAKTVAALEDAQAKALQDVQEMLDAAQMSFTVACNPQYLLDMVKLAGTARVQFRLVDPYKPFLILPVQVEAPPKVRGRKTAPAPKPTVLGGLVPGEWNLLMPIRVGRAGEPDPGEVQEIRPDVQAAQPDPAAGPEPVTPTAEPDTDTTAAPAVTAEPEPDVAAQAVTQARAARLARLAQHMQPGERYIRAVVEGVSHATRKFNAGLDGEEDLVEAEAAAGFRERGDVGRLRAGDPIATVATPEQVALADQARAEFQSGRHAEALALIDEGARLAPGVVLGVGNGKAYGWAEIREYVVKHSPVKAQAEPEPTVVDVEPEPQAETEDEPVAKPDAEVPTASADALAGVLTAMNLDPGIVAAAVQAVATVVAPVSVTSLVVTPPATSVPVDTGEVAGEGGWLYALPPGTPLRVTAKALRQQLARTASGIEFHVYGVRGDNGQLNRLRVTSSVDSEETSAMVAELVQRLVSVNA